MKPHETARIKRILQYIKIARTTDWISFNAMIRGESFEKEVLKPLEQISGWDEKDEQLVRELAAKFDEQSQGKSLKEKTDILKRIIVVGGGTATAIGLISLLVWLTKRGKKNAGK